MREAAKAVAAMDHEVQALEEGIRVKFQAIERSTAAATAGRRQPLAEPLPDETFRLLGPAIAAEIKLARGFTADCDAMLKQYRLGELPGSEIREQQGGLRRRLEGIDVEYIRLGAFLDQARQNAQQALAAQTPADIVKALLEDYESARRLADAETVLATRIEAVQKHFAETLKSYTALRKHFEAFCDKFASWGEGNQGARVRLQQVRGEAISLRIDPNAIEDQASLPANLRLQASRLRLLTSQAPPTLMEGETTPPAELAKAEKIQAQLGALAGPADEMTLAVETARDRFKQLRNLVPTDPPIFRLTAKEAGKQVFDLVVAGDRVPQGAQIKYVWDFGDQKQEATKQPSHRHAYASPGPFTATVRVFIERPRFSELLGEASATVGGGGATTPASPPPAGAPESAFMMPVSFTFDDEPGGLKSVYPNPLDFMIFPASNRFVARYTIRRKMYMAADRTYYYCLDAVGSVECALDSMRTEFELPIPRVSWQEGVYQTRLSANLGRVNVENEGHRGANRPAAYAQMGRNPQQMRWAGMIRGSLDWRSGRLAEATGRLEINNLTSGTWKVSAQQYLPVAAGSGAGIESMREGCHIRALSLYPTIEDANRHRPMGGIAPIHSGADLTVWRSGAQFAAQMGRWHVLWTQMNPRDYTPQCQKVRDYIAGPGQILEKAVPDSRSR